MTGQRNPLEGRSPCDGYAMYITPLRRVLAEASHFMNAMDIQVYHGDEIGSGGNRTTHLMTKLFTLVINKTL